MDGVSIQCLNPQKIVNPYTKEPMIVSCGKCDACKLQKSSVAALKCKLESLSHKYTYFVTLTFNNQHLPLATAEYDHPHHMLLDEKSGQIFGHVPTTYRVMKQLAAKVNMNGYFPYLDKTILQKFIKRLRYYAKHRFNETLRYYGVGEYGPVHYRPHFHLLLWFENEDLAASMAEYINKSWTFGYTHTEKVLNDASSYVAGYLNSSCNLPLIYQLEAIKPFAVHSHHLGEAILSRSKEEVYKSSVEDFVRRSMFINGIDTEFTLWRSVKDYFFPKCVGYSRKSRRERLHSYCIYDAARRWTGETRPAVQARYIFETLSRSQDFQLDNCAVECIQYFKPFPLLYENKDELIRRIYMELRISHHFLTFVCNGTNPPHPIEVQSKLDMIEHFYLELDRLGLNKQLEHIEYFMRYDCGDVDDLKYLYHNIPFDKEEYLDTKMAQVFKSYVVYRKEMSVKHKILNDQNLIFNNK